MGKFANGTLGIALLILVLPQNGQALPTFSVSTDKLSYVAGETVHIFGTVSEAKYGEVVGIQVFNPENTVYTIAQPDVNADGTFSYDLKIGGKLGINGIYTVKAIYNGEVSYTKFELSGEPPWKPSAGTITLHFEDHTWDVNVSLSNGSIQKIEIDKDFTSVVLIVSTTDKDGNLTITLPRDLIDAKTTKGDDAHFSVLVDGNSVSFTEFGSSFSVRTMSIVVLGGSTEIEIIGTEFLGQIKCDSKPCLDLYGRWYKDPIRYAIEGDSSASSDDFKMISDAFNEWSSWLKSSSGNYNAWNLEPIATATDVPDILVRIIKSPQENCSILGTSYVTSRVAKDKQLLAPVTDYVYTSCKGENNDSTSFYHAALHEIGHSLGLGHAFFMTDDLMCSEQEGKRTCGSEYALTLYPSGADLDALLLLYGNNGFAESNHANFFSDNYFVPMSDISGWSKHIVVPNPEPSERFTISEPVLAGVLVGENSGQTVVYDSINKSILIQSTVKNNQNIDQDYAYIVQVKDFEGHTVDLTWVSGVLPRQESIKVGQDWVPDKRGSYDIEIFVWESVDNPVPLAPAKGLLVKVES